MGSAPQSTSTAHVHGRRALSCRRDTCSRRSPAGSAPCIRAANIPRSAPRSPPIPERVCRLHCMPPRSDATIPAFKHYIADRAWTDIRCFPSINSAGTLRGGLAGPIIHTPEVVDVELLVTEANAHPRLVRGFGEIQAETGAVSRWDVDVVRIAREASDRTAL